MSRQVVCFNTVEKVSTLCVFTDSFIDIYVSVLYFHVQRCGAEPDVGSINPRRSPEGHLGEIWVEVYRRGEKCRSFRYPVSRQETNKRPHSVTLIHFAPHTELSAFLN